MALQTQVVAVDAAVQSTGANVDAIIAIVPHGVVLDRTEGTLILSPDPLKPARQIRVDPGDYVVTMTLDSKVYIIVLTAAQYDDLVETVPAP